MSTYYVVVKKELDTGLIMPTAFSLSCSLAHAAEKAMRFNSHYADTFYYFVVSVDEEELTCS